MSTSKSTSSSNIEFIISDIAQPTETICTTSKSSFEVTSSCTTHKNIKNHCSLHSLKVVIRDKSNNEIHNDNNINKMKRTTNRYIRKRLSSNYHQQRARQACTSRNRIQESITQYKHMINGTPTKTCTMCQMLNFHKKICQVNEETMKAFSMLPITTTEKKIEVNQSIIKQCLKAMLLSKVPSYVVPWNIRRSS